MAHKSNIPQARGYGSFPAGADCASPLRMRDVLARCLHDGSCQHRGQHDQRERRLDPRHLSAEGHRDDRLQRVDMEIPPFSSIDQLPVHLGIRVRVRIGNLTMTNHPIHLHGAGCDGDGIDAHVDGCDRHARP